MAFIYQVDPRTRLTISDVLDRMAAIGETRGFQMKAGLKLKVPAQVATSQTQPQLPARPNATIGAQASPQPPRRPPPPNPSANSQPRQLSPNPAPPQNHPITSSLPTSGLLSSLKGGAGSLFKNLKVSFET